MGSPPDELHRGRNSEDLTSVRYTRPIAVQQREVTQAEWVAAGFPNLAGTQWVDDGPGRQDCVADGCPAASLGWCEAVEFANRRSRAEGRQECMKLLRPRGTVGVDFECDGAEPTGASYYACDGYRLPTAGEWERAARGGTQTAFANGPWPEGALNDCVENAALAQIGWWCANSAGTSHPVCELPPNGFGLFDMAGNVAELIADAAKNGYGPGPVTDPPLATFDREPDWTFARGGNFFAEPMPLRPAWVGHTVVRTGPYARWPGVGFRLVRTLSEQEAAGWGAGR